MADWKFKSTHEQREAFRKEFPYRDDFTEEEAKAWAERATYLWRGTLTRFDVETLPGGSFGVVQDLIQ